jgi:hypothetical protein
VIRETLDVIVIVGAASAAVLAFALCVALVTL